MLMMFYLAEYLHLVITSVHFVLFFFGGWFGLSVFFFVTPNFLTPNASIFLYLI
jgi:NADH:ubiquinone oxidoreductase subunit H